jgi:cytoskeleton-associated protein 5
VLKELASYPRLANGDYADVNRELKKIISKDSNIAVRVVWCCVVLCVA